MSRAAPAAAAVRSLWPRILLFGDSLTQYSFSYDGGWGALIADAFQRQVDVLCRGFSGYNTRHCRALLDTAVGVTDLTAVEVAVVWLGANDASLPASPQTVPILEYQDNLKAIVDHFKANGIGSVILVTPPPLDADAWSVSAVDRGLPMLKAEALTAQYAAACRQVTIDADVPCADVHAAMMKCNTWRTYLCDGLHLSRSGSELVASLLIPMLSECLGRRLVKEGILPNWSILDCNNPSVTFDDWLKRRIKTTDS